MTLQAFDERPATKAVFRALGSPHDREILALAQGGPVDARTIIARTGFPKSTVYRRLNQLESEGLLRCEHGVIRQGHAVDRYVATIRDVEFSLNNGVIHLEMRWVGRNTEEVLVTERDEATTRGRSLSLAPTSETTGE